LHSDAGSSLKRLLHSALFLGILLCAGLLTRLLTAGLLSRTLPRLLPGTLAGLILRRRLAARVLAAALGRRERGTEPDSDRSAQEASANDAGSERLEDLVARSHCVLLLL
jgi:hypothetical protein